MAFSVEYRPEAETDFQSIFDYVAEAAGIEVAEAYEARIRRACDRLVDFPGRGTPRDELEPGLRTVSFERRAVIAYFIEADTVVIVRILYGGRDIDSAFSED